MSLELRGEATGLVERFLEAFSAADFAAMRSMLAEDLVAKTTLAVQCTPRAALLTECDRAVA